MKRFLILLTAITFFTCSSVFADNEDDYYDEPEELDELDRLDMEAEQLEEEKFSYEEAAAKAAAVAKMIQAEIDSVSEFKRQLDAEAAVATADYEEKQAALDETLYRIAENENTLAAVTAELNEKHDVLEKRVRDIYINGQISYLDVLFGAQDFGDFLTRMDLLKRVMIRDSELVANVLAYQTEIKEVGKKLEADKKVQTELAVKAEAAKDIKLEKVAQQQALIDLMQNDKEIYNQQYDEMMASSAEVERLIQENRYKKAAEEEARRRRAEMGASDDWGGEEYVMQNYGSGMIWPISGPITSEFGWRTHPIFGNARFHSGLDIGGDYGLPIHAAQGGIVIEAGWLGGYGNTVMIDHGGGIVTLYGHNESLAVDVGQYVNQGQVIAYCGSTGNSTGPHCHFEVRLGGEPVSPWDYL